MVRFTAVVTFALAIMGCSGPSAAVEDQGGGPVADSRFDLSTTEDFDERPYEDSLVVELAVSHDVPDVLMRSEAAEGITTARTVQGYRIQIHASLERDAALQIEDGVARWWNSLATEQRPINYRPDDLPVHMRFVTPYYRVRIGSFEDRESAEAFLAFLGDRYPDAFLVLDSITVYR